MLKAIKDIPGSPEPSDKHAATKIEHPEIGAMVEVPAGEFIYQDWKAFIEKPYMIDVYPVTNQQYQEFINENGYKNHGYWSKEGQVWLRKMKPTEPRYWTDEKFNQPDHQVVGVNYYEAEALAKWAGKRLPTEKEWERAAPGIDGHEYPWGDQFDQERCNTAESNIRKTTHVARYPNGVSPVGCYDMAGNVWEWNCGKEKMLVLRGGSWSYNKEIARCAFRGKNGPGLRNGNMGFRCVKDI